MDVRVRPPFPVLKIMPTRTEEYMHWKDRGNLSNKEVAFICDVTKVTVSRWNSQYKVEKGIIKYSKQACVPGVQKIKTLKAYVLEHRKEAKSVRREVSKDRAKWLADDLRNSFAKVMKIKTCVEDLHFDAAQELITTLHSDVLRFALEIEQLKNMRS